MEMEMEMEMETKMETETEADAWEDPVRGMSEARPWTAPAPAAQRVR